MEGVTIAANLHAARSRIDAACARVGRAPSEVELLPVSKTHPVSRVVEAQAAGYARFGESRPQELRDKAVELTGTGIDWVLIGHLQSNKAKLAAEHAAEFQALDSVALGEALDRRLVALGRQLPVLVEVNTSSEEAKHGFAPADVPAAVRALGACDALDVRGLMTIAVNSPDAAAVRACFERLVDLQARLRDAAGGGFDTLSMGMSGDFEIAVEMGSTCVRLGTTIFGARPSSDR